MNAYASSGDNFARSIEHLMETVEVEVRHAVAYVDAVVVPQVRKESSTALRLLAKHMERLADSLHPENTSL